MCVYISFQRFVSLGFRTPKVKSRTLIGFYQDHLGVSSTNGIKYFYDGKNVYFPWTYSCEIWHKVRTLNTNKGKNPKIGNLYLDYR